MALPFWVPFGFPLASLTSNSLSGGIKDFILNPLLSMVSHISVFKGTQGPDSLSFTPQCHCLHWPTLLAKVLPSPFLAWHLLQHWLVEGRLGWEEGGPGPFFLLLLSHQDLVLTRGLEEHVVPWPWAPAAAPWSSVLPHYVLWTSCVCIHLHYPLKTNYWAHFYSFGLSTVAKRFLCKH